MSGSEPLKGLKAPIAAVQAIDPAIKPLFSYAKQTATYSSGRDLLHKRPPDRSVDALCAQRLLTALQAAKRLGTPDGLRAATKGVTVEKFRSASDAERLAIINAIWNAATSREAFNTLAENMFEPSGDTPGPYAPLPTSWCPTSAGATTYEKRLKTRRPWREFTIGFRVDDSTDAGIARITGKGMTQQRLDEKFMVGFRGQMITPEIASDTSMARFWLGSHDIYNESAVCVARNLFGATAFPERITDDGGEAKRLLWAVSLFGLLGFDTEQKQLALGTNRNWRPGEKAFAHVPKERVLGYVRIARRGAGSSGGWRFTIPTNAAWTWVGSPTKEQKAYCEQELDAWRGAHDIDPRYDFALAADKSAKSHFKLLEEAKAAAK
jgi:hypothetical protein